MIPKKSVIHFSHGTSRTMVDGLIHSSITSSERRICVSSQREKVAPDFYFQVLQSDSNAMKEEIIPHAFFYSDIDPI